MSLVCTHPRSAIRHKRAKLKASDVVAAIVGVMKSELNDKSVGESGIKAGLTEARADTGDTTFFNVGLKVAPIVA